MHGNKMTTDNGSAVLMWLLFYLSYLFIYFYFIIYFFYLFIYYLFSTNRIINYMKVI